jgi:hypothetical protein
MNAPTSARPDSARNDTPRLSRPRTSAEQLPRAGFTFVRIVALLAGLLPSLASFSFAAQPPLALEPRAESLWSFQPVRRSVPPDVLDRQWPRNSIDRFILARLEQAGLRPAPPAGRADLIRRVYFDLLGLPPAPEEIAAFVEDPAADAYERLIERLLNSPHYGERWAQHWLDVVRFAETEGFEYDRNIPDAWRYRDYVVQSFNRDKPYDRFILEQLAGDEIDAENPELLVAAGFHRLGPVRRNAGNQEVASSRNEVLTVSRAHHRLRPLPRP